MKTRFAAVMLAALLAVTVFAPAAEALTRKLYVTPIIGMTEPCRAAPDQVQYSYTFRAKIKRKNSPNPKRVTIKYKVTDLTAGAVVVEQTLVLKPNRSKARHFFKVGALAQYTAAHQLQIDVNASFKSPLNGKTYRSTSTVPDSIPTVEALDAINPPLSACAVG